MTFRFPRTTVLASIVLALLVGFARADVRLSAIFTSHMVLQRDMPIRVWGWADPGEIVTVRFGENRAVDVAGPDGTWAVDLPAMSASATGRALVARGKNTVTLEDVLVGEVWLCSGQSNMEWPVDRSQDAKTEIAAAHFPLIRHFTVTRLTSPTPLEDVTGTWEVCSPETIAPFSAVGYFFGRELQRDLKIPIGLVDATWGGTPSEAWTSQETLEGIVEAQPILERHRQAMEIDNGADAIAASDHDDSGWKEVKVPGHFKTQGFDVDGYVWYRREISIPFEWVGLDLALNLGPIDDDDVTWFAGERIGTTSGWKRERRYVVPGHLVKWGRTVVAVRVHDGAGAGGICGRPEQLTIHPVGKPNVAHALAGDWKCHVDVRRSARKMWAPSRPAHLYNAMIAPIRAMRYRGVIWYQGESNSGRAQQYESIFPAMIHDWRARLDRPDLPFLFVQIANYQDAVDDAVQDSSWAHIRWAQTVSHRAVPGTGLAVITDIGDADDIHPRNKQDVGRRLARWAFADVYGRDDVVKSGPLFREARIEGKTATVTFDVFGSKLAIRSGDRTLGGFALAGADGQFHAADAMITSRDTVRVTSTKVPQPRHVRYAWASNPIRAGLVNTEGLPASLFRTDSLPGPTDGVR